MTIADRIIAHVTRRAPDFQIGGAQDPYLNRWWVIPRNRFFNIYLHQFIRDDDDRANHSHPWLSLSWLMRGILLEFTDAWRTIKTGQWRFRRAKFYHRLAIPDECRGNTYTLFITGPRIREWDFDCPQGLVHWQKFTAGKNGEMVGKGCDQ